MIHKNTYLLIWVIFVFTLQFIFNCSNSFAYERSTNVYSTHKVINQNWEKNHNKKYNKKNDKNSVSQQAKVVKDKEQLNISDFPGKKDSQETIENLQKEKPVSGINFLWTFFALFFVLAIIVFLGQLFNKLRNTDPAMLLAGKFGEKSSTNRFNILSTTSLGQGRNIHLVEINGKHLVIGSTMNNVSLLTELDSNQISDRDKNKSINDEDNVNEFKEHENFESGYNEIYKEYLKEKDTKSNQDNNDL